MTHVLLFIFSSIFVISVQISICIYMYYMRAGQEYKMQPWPVNKHKKMQENDTNKKEYNFVKTKKIH